MKILLLPSLARDTGCWVRAGHLARALRGYAEVEIVHPPARGLPWLLDVVLSAPRHLWRAWTTDADVVLGCKPFPNVAMALRAAQLRGRRAVLDVDDLDWGWFPGWRGTLLRALMKRVPRRADLVTYHSEELGKLLHGELGVPNQRMHALGQGVDLDLFCPRKELTERNSLLWVGHLNVAADLEPVLEAVRWVQQRRRAGFTVAGGGPLLRHFQERARRLGVAAVFTGPVTVEEAAEAVARADLCLVYLADRDVNRYRCSMKLRECLAAGKKVVANDVGELAAFADYVYASGSGVTDYAGRILEVLESGGDGRELQGAEHVRRHCDWRRLAGALHRRLEELLAS